MNSVWVSLSTYGGVTTKDALSVFWEAGMRQVELAIGVKPSPNTTAILRHYQDQGMKYRAHHAIVWEEHRPFNLAQSLNVPYFERLTDWLAMMNIQAYSVHAGSYPPAGNRSIAWFTFLENLACLLQLCRDRRIRLGVETMYPALAGEGKQYFLQDAPEVDQVLHALPELGLVVDMAHLNLWQHTPVEVKLNLLQQYSHRLLEVHVSDNDGHRDSHTPIHKHTWWVSHAALMPPDVPVVLESRMNHQSGAQVKHHCEYLQTILQEEHR